MGVFVRCRNCGNNVYLLEEKIEIPGSFGATCPYCQQKYSYLNSEAIEERWDFTCPYCSRPFFIRKSPPLRVRCPHSRSILYIGSDGELSLMDEGQLPPTARPGPVGAVGGLVIGGLVAGPVGALLGLLAGGAIGASVEPLEAEEV